MCSKKTIERPEFQSMLTATPGVTIVGNSATGGFTAWGFGGEITVKRTTHRGPTTFTVTRSGNTGTPSPGQFGGGAGYGGASPQRATSHYAKSSSIDALQEFRATTSTYSREFGRTPGGPFS